MSEIGQIWIAAIAIIPATVGAIAAAIIASRVHGIAKETKTLVNGNLRAFMLLNVATTARLAEISKLPADVLAAELATTTLKEHDAKVKQ